MTLLLFGVKKGGVKKCTKFDAPISVIFGRLPARVQEHAIEASKQEWPLQYKIGASKNVQKMTPPFCPVVGFASFAIPP